MSRSPELRQFLSQDQSPEELHDKIQDQIRSSAKYDYGRGEAQGMRERYETAKAEIEELEEKARMLKEISGELDDTDFEAVIGEIESASQDIFDRVTLGDDYKHERKYTTGAVEWKDIRNLDDFLKRTPMFWIPTKEEVGRVLATAKMMHASAVERGERQPTDPVRILDIGGANGAMGKLVVDLAKENGLAVEYAITDPYEQVVAETRKIYADTPEMKFEALSAADYTVKEYADDEEIGPLVQERRRLQLEGNQKMADLETVMAIVSKKRQSRRDVGEDTTTEDQPLFDEAELSRLYAMMENDLGIRLSPEAKSDCQRFILELEGGWDDEIGEHWPKAAEFVRQDFQRRYEALTADIEIVVAKRAPRHELVINSWMPPHLDFTADIRAAGGAAIIYFIQTYGATGYQVGSMNPEDPRLVGESDSYGTGKVYREEAMWVGRSSPELAAAKSGWGNSDQICNGALIQVRSDEQRRYATDFRPHINGIVADNPYPWEPELRSKHGQPSRIVPMNGNRKGRLVDYHDELYDLIKQKVMQSDY